jgi:superfamily II DNA or RNA helicase
MTMIECKNRIDVTLRDYQKEAIDFLNTNDGKLVLAMCPSSGKTETIIYYLNEQYNLNPNLKVLILPHSTNVLLDNFYQRLESRNVDFTYSSDVNDDVNVHVVLPQNHNRIVGHYDLIIIDEAHENYLAKTIQGIIKKTQSQKEILLTGTPSKFIGKKDYKFFFVALSDIDKSLLPKLRVEIVESEYQWNGNYCYERELKKSYKFKTKETNNILKKVFDSVLKCDEKSIKKTIIVCRDINHSKLVKSYLDSIGFCSEISNSENDKNSELVSKFKNNEFNILIVVNRARLGYDDADLINLIDISGTLNPNIIYQMMARVLRGTDSHQKKYIRITSKDDDIYNSEIATSVALMLMHKKYIEKFNGLNFNLNEIIVSDSFLTKTKTQNKLSDTSKKSTKRKLLIDTDDVISYYKEAIDLKEDKKGFYKFCLLQDVLILLDAKIRIRKYTLEQCKENALKYKMKTEWLKKDQYYYQCAVRNNWLKECTAHMEVKTIEHTFESCMESALKHSTKKDWKNADIKSYAYAVRKGIYDKCTAHMEKITVKHSHESVFESALKYSNLKDWRTNNVGMYKYAKQHKIIKECTAHMKTYFVRHTFESCMKSALKYSNVKDWRLVDDKSYSYARKKGWLKECTAHMEVKTIKHTFESCMKSALKYSTKRNWSTSKEDGKLYRFALKEGWLKECTAHMEVKIVQHTFESCMESASKHTNKKDWRLVDNKSYSYARKHGWLKECTAHMIHLRLKKPYN